jgi:hypothetical protein
MASKRPTLTASRRNNHLVAEYDAAESAAKSADAGHHPRPTHWGDATAGEGPTPARVGLATVR